jgi:putative ubiquitin-RnfH superfamily antitoxin RatB of RatAB toxin-antitoxin module
MARVEICFPENSCYHCLTVEVQEGATIAQVLQEAGLGDYIAKGFSVGIWSKIKPWETSVATGDRIEIYMPLKVDPKNLRRQKAKEQRKKP